MGSVGKCGLFPLFSKQVPPQHNIWCSFCPQFCLSILIYTSNFLTSHPPHTGALSHYLSSSFPPTPLSAAVGVTAWHILPTNQPISQPTNVSNISPLSPSSANILRFASLILAHNFAWNITFPFHEHNIS